MIFTTDYESLENELRALGIRCERFTQLSHFSSFRIGGRASLTVWPDSQDKLVKAVELLTDRGVRFEIIGNASNILFDSDGYEGTLVFTGGLNAVSRDGTLLLADCGASFTQLAYFAQKNGLSGLEFAYGIPGSVGGAVFMNAGAYGGETAMALESSDWYDPQTRTVKRLDAAGHAFGYRHSVFMEKGGVILRSAFRLKEGDPAEIRAVMDEHMAARREKQPLEYPSAGSVFKRHEGYFTAKLIDEAGFKGASVGGAQVSPKHAGFIVNTGGATSSDVLALIEQIRRKIRELHGIDIECEIRYLPVRSDACGDESCERQEP